MGGGSRGPTKAESEAQELQNERLRKERDAAERSEKEAAALVKARRKGGASSLIKTGETGTQSGFKSLLGG